MSKSVDIQVRIDPACPEPVVVIHTASKSQDVENIVHAIENCMDSEYPLIIGQRGASVELLSQRDVVRVYSEARHVRISTVNGLYDSNKSLSWLEMQLNPDRFIRISRYEIVNIRKIARFDFSMAGTIQIVLDDGCVTWAARRYVRAIQQVLKNLEGKKEDARDV